MSKVISKARKSQLDDITSDYKLEKKEQTLIEEHLRRMEEEI